MITPFIFLWGNLHRPTASLWLARLGEPKRESVSSSRQPRRAPTHTECGFKVLDPKGEGSPKIAEIVYNVIKDITTRGDHYDGDNTLIYCLYKNKISK